MIIDKSGRIITNNHVVEDADTIKVKLKDEREFEATIIGRDPQTDLILEVNRQNVTSTGELKQLLAKYKGGDGVSLLVQRSNAGMMVLKMV